MDGQCRSAGRLSTTDLRLVGALCELALAARRLGCRVWVLDPSPDLRELMELTGLTEVLLDDDETRRT